MEADRIRVFCSKLIDLYSNECHSYIKSWSTGSPEDKKAHAEVREKTNNLKRELEELLKIEN
jgi:hypothetical protein